MMAGKFDQAEYVAGYLKEKYEKMTLAAPKGEITDFKAACEARGTKATSVLRRFMAEYVSEYRNTLDPK